MRLNVLLWDLMFDFNLGFIIRDVYMLGNNIVRLFVYDPQGLLIANQEAINRYSGFAMENYKHLTRFGSHNEALKFIRSSHGRIIYTLPDETSAVEVDAFSFQDGDLIVFGNEHYGIPDGLLPFATSKIIIPMYGGVYTRPDFGGEVTKVGEQRCLSVHSSFAIILYLAVKSCTAYRRWRDSYAEPVELVTDKSK